MRRRRTSRARRACCASATWSRRRSSRRNALGALRVAGAQRQDRSCRPRPTYQDHIYYDIQNVPVSLENGYTVAQPAALVCERRHTVGDRGLREQRRPTRSTSATRSTSPARSASTSRPTGAALGRGELPLRASLTGRRMAEATAAPRSDGADERRSLIAARSCWASSGPRSSSCSRASCRAWCSTWVSTTSAAGLHGLGRDVRHRGDHGRDDLRSRTASTGARSCCASLCRHVRDECGLARWSRDVTTFAVAAVLRRARRRRTDLAVASRPSASRATPTATSAT